MTDGGTFANLEIQACAPSFCAGDESLGCDQVLGCQIQIDAEYIGIIGQRRMLRIKIRISEKDTASARRSCCRIASLQSG